LEEEKPRETASRHGKQGGTVRTTKTLRILWTAAVIAGGLTGVSVATLAATPASAVTSQCLIINKAINTNNSYNSLAAAEAAASPGATLLVRGMCTGNTEISENLSVLGSPVNGFTTPTLEGTGTGSVLTVDPGVTLTVNGLTISGGTGNTGIPVGIGFPSMGGAILDSGGTVNLLGGSITNNSADFGGGIAVVANLGGIPGPATLNVIGGTITHNTGGSGGGIVNFGGTVNVSGGSISNNGYPAGFASNGGGIFSDEGTLNISGGAISNNTAGFLGAGVYADYAAAVNITGGSIDHNQGANGGGLTCGTGSYCTLSMSGGTISNNSAVAAGGGIDLEFGSASISGGSITDNTAPAGGGILVGGDGSYTPLDLSGGSIDHNTANTGGGIWNNGTTFLNGGSITYNTAGTGGGIENATFVSWTGVLQNDATTIANNTPQDVCPAYDSYNSSGC
jgi:hypothetical protein